MMDPLYRLYTRRLERELDPERLPQHVAVIMDGNRRWARAIGEPAGEGHRRGAEKIHELLAWCEELGIGTVTLWMLSTDNFSRSTSELATLFEVITEAVEKIARNGHEVHLVGATGLLPDEFADRIGAVAGRPGRPGAVSVNVAIGYGGRQEIVDAVRDLLRQAAAEGRSLEDVAEGLSIEQIGDHLYTKGQPDPDLIIRTSGELRVGGFLMWQSQHSEFYFCEAYWPGFRKIDFLRALRDYGCRERRFGK